MKVCLGGTFQPFHVGHEAMLREAFRDADEVFVGITTGDLSRRDDRDVPDWQDRARTVEAFAAAEGFAGHLVVRALDDPDGPAATGEYDVIIVSAETRRGAERINATRAKDGLEPLRVRVVPFTRGQDLLPVHGTRIAAGDVDRDGRRLRPVRVAVGSRNPVKVAAVEAAVADILGMPVEVRAFDVDTGVPEQPRDGQILAGARARADAAQSEWKDADYAVGIEAGLNQDPDGEAWYDAQACVVVDAEGQVTDGWGPAFQYPDWVTERALAGEMVSDILGPIAGDPRIGGTTGAIGFLTDGRMDRTELTHIAVLMAFVPRIRAGLYEFPPGKAHTS